MSHTSSMWNKIPKWTDTVLHQPFLQPHCSDWMTETRIVTLVSTHTKRKLKRAFLKHSLVFSTHPGWFAISGNFSLLQGTLSQQKQAESESWCQVAAGAETWRCGPVWCPALMTSLLILTRNAAHNALMVVTIISFTQQSIRPLDRVLFF